MAARRSAALSSSSARSAAYARSRSWNVYRPGVCSVSRFAWTAVGGGGRITDVLHSDAPWLLGWEKFTFISLGSGVYGIQTIDGHYLTAVGAGGRVTDTIHSDATGIFSWEKFRVVCGV